MARFAHSRPHPGSPQRPGLQDTLVPTVIFSSPPRLLRTLLSPPRLLRTLSSPPRFASAARSARHARPHRYILVPTSVAAHTLVPTSVASHTLVPTLVASAALIGVGARGKWLASHALVPTPVRHDGADRGGSQGEMARSHTLVPTPVRHDGQTYKRLVSAIVLETGNRFNYIETIRISAIKSACS